MRPGKCLFGVLMVCANFLVSCTEPGETTGVGAAAGGVLGAGLGVIVGNQTGDPGSGLVVGALAGSAAGAAVGNALEAQQESIRTQDEALERQEAVLNTQSKEIEELRRRNREEVRVDARNEVGYPESKAPVLNMGRGVNTTNFGHLQRPSPLLESHLNSENEITDIAPKSANSPECQNAESEVEKARQVVEPSERLFHYRRALRMCPENPEYHNGLGEVYISLDRKEDAKFEFQEALRIDSTFSQAKDNLALLHE